MFNPCHPFKMATLQASRQKSSVWVQALISTVNHCAMPSDSGVRNHAAGTHDFGQITARHYGRWLIIDTTLEASRAPIHELNGALGLDGGNCCVHVFWHHISLAMSGGRNMLSSLRLGGNWSQKNVQLYIYQSSTVDPFAVPLESLPPVSSKLPRYIMQQAMYLPWRGSHFTIMDAGSKTDIVISATESCSW